MLGGGGKSSSSSSSSIPLLNPDFFTSFLSPVIEDLNRVA